MAAFGLPFSVFDCGNAEALESTALQVESRIHAAVGALQRPGKISLLIMMRFSAGMGKSRAFRPYVSP